MDRLLDVLLRPDNIPVLGMLAALVWLAVVWLRQALHNDRLTAQGRRDDIRKDMDR